MAAVTFSYRSPKDEADLEIRLSFKDYNNARRSLYTRSRISVSRTFWDSFKTGKNFRDIDKIRQKNEVQEEMNKIQEYILDEFEKANISLIGKQWLKEVVIRCYNPPKARVGPPIELLSYIDYFLQLNANDLSNELISKWNTIRKKMKKFENELGSPIHLKDMDEEFKFKFGEFYKSESYAQNTLQREWGFIKTLCRHARVKGVKVPAELDSLSFKKEKVPKVYLSFDELTKIDKLNDLPDYLDNARDWLIISCYVGQRVSDFMRFRSSMIRIENGIRIIEFTQKKTKKHMAIPVLPEVESILSKRNGEFPRKISNARYTDYIKLVCKTAGLLEESYGKVQINISKSRSRPQLRKVPGFYPKYKLIASQVGRRSFATNYYGKLPTTYLTYITGHTTERMFLNYIGKANKDMAMDVYNAFTKLNDRN